MMEAGPVEDQVEQSAHRERLRRALEDVKSHLKGRALKFAGFLLVVYAVLKLIPAFKQALHALQNASWEWVVALIALEILSETGFVLAWGRIVDPDNVLGRGTRGRTTDLHVAWTQLGSGLIVPGGSWGGMGVAGLILHRFGMPNKLIGEREFNLSFLNTAIDALALVVFGIGLATGILTGEDNLLLTLLPAALAGAGIVAAPLLAPRLSAAANRRQSKHPKIATAITTVADAVEDTKQLLIHRDAWVPVVGIVGYLIFDVLVLWFAFKTVNANPVPGFGVVIMGYIIGALGGSLPLPAAAGTIGGVAGMLIVYGVAHNVALAAVLLHQAIGLLVPLIGGAIGYAILRHRLGPIRERAASDPGAAQTTAPGK